MLFVMVAVLGMLSILPFVTPAECVGESCSAGINLTVDNIAPVINGVFPVSAITLNGGTVSEIVVDFNVTDENGWGDIDDQKYSVILTRGGEETRYQKNGSCGFFDFHDDNTIIVRCSVEMQFYDGEGAWNISVSANDTAGETATNDSTGTTVNALDYVSQDVISAIWGSVTLGTDDEEADNTVTLTNGGNQVYTSFDLTGQASTGELYSSVIDANKFSVDSDTGQTTGQIYMVDNTPVDVSSLLSLSTRGADVTEEIFFYADIPLSIRADTYISDSAWDIQLA